MAKIPTGPDPVSDPGPYEPAFFALKYNMTLKAAEVVLHANGPSRNACDGAARAFTAAVAARKQLQFEKDQVSFRRA